MLIAYNNDIEFRSRWYHIQTEDNGLKDGHITTTVFFSGQILDSKTTSYLEAIAGIDNSDEQNKIIKDAMTNQHKFFYAKLYEGSYDAIVNAPHKSSSINGAIHANSLPPQAKSPVSPVSIANSPNLQNQLVGFRHDSSPDPLRKGKPDILRASQQLPVANKNLSVARQNASPLSIKNMAPSSSSFAISSPSSAHQAALRRPLPTSNAVEASRLQKKHTAWRGVKWPQDDLSLDLIVAKLLAGEDI